MTKLEFLQYNARIHNDAQRKVVKPEFWQIKCELCGTNPSNHPYGNVCKSCSDEIPF